MICSACGQPADGKISGMAGDIFCTDICHLRYWKNEMPNLGGSWISEADLSRLCSLKGYERRHFYNGRVSYILDNFYSSPLMMALRRGKPGED